MAAIGLRVLEATSDLLEDDLQSTSNVQVRSGIINSLWNPNGTAAAHNFYQDSPHFDSFFEYYDQQCAAARFDAKNGGFLVKTHRDLINVIRELHDMDKPKTLIKFNLRRELLLTESEENDARLDDAINLAARIWLMIFVGEYRQIIGPAQRQLVWQENSCLKTVLEHEFSPQVKVKDHVRLERLFTSRNMERIAGLEIIWTSNLADHLRLVDYDTRVVIFHQASFLKSAQSQYVPPF